MTDKYLVFSVDFSGVSEKIYSSLNSRGVELEIVKIPKIWRLYFYSIITSFNLNYKKWIVKSERKYNGMQKTPWAFKSKSKWCAKYIKNINSCNYSGIIQISGTFDCTKYQKPKLPLYILTDYTMKLAESKSKQTISPLLPPSSEDLSNWYKLETELYFKAKKIIIPSAYISKSLSNHYGVNTSNISVIGYGANLQPKNIVEKKQPSKDGPHFLFVGKMFEQKGGKIIVDAFSKIKEKLNGATLTIVGPRVDPCIEADGILYLGRIYDKKKLSELYRSSDMFLIHSAYEAFGLVLLEAMAHGLPCIGSDIDAMPDILSQTNAGSVVKFGSSDALSEEILRYLNCDELYASASQSGITAIETYYNWDSVGDRFYRALTDSE